MIFPMRTLIDLPQRAVAALAEICRRERISRAEAIRRAVALYVAQRKSTSEEEVFGLWRKRELEGRVYEDKLRDEWHEREGRS